MRRGRAKHICDCGRGPRIWLTHFDGVRCSAYEFRVRLLRELYWRLSDGRADVQIGIRDEESGDVGRIETNGDRYYLSLLRSRLHADGSRAGRGNRQSEFTAGPFGYAGTPVHQGPVWLAVCADPRKGIAGGAPHPLPLFFVSIHSSGVTWSPPPRRSSTGIDGEGWHPYCFCKCAQRYESKRDAAFLGQPVCAKCAQAIEKK